MIANGGFVTNWECSRVRWDGADTIERHHVVTSGSNCMWCREPVVREPDAQHPHVWVTVEPYVIAEQTL